MVHVATGAMIWQHNDTKPQARGHETNDATPAHLAFIDVHIRHTIEGVLHRRGHQFLNLSLIRSNRLVTIR